MSRLKRTSLIIIPIILIILELFPDATVLKFISYDGDKEYVYHYYPYFSLIPFGYALFGPLLTALNSCLLLVLSVFSFLKNKSFKIIFWLSLIGLITSISPLFYGVDYFTLIGLVISICYMLYMFLNINIMKIES